MEDEMIRVNRVQLYINEIFDTVLNANEQQSAYIHSYGVAQCASLLALIRRLDPEMAVVIGLLHDIYSYKTGYYPLHSINGAEMIKVVFKNELNGIFSDKEQNIIKSAIYHHSDKNHVHDEYDELLKDSDVLQHYLQDATIDIDAKERLSSVCNELGIPQFRKDQIKDSNKKTSLFSSDILGDIAQGLAKKEVVGECANNDFMEIIKYFPESSAYDELKFGWCAAFVYHCCIKAGLYLPLRATHTATQISDTRFACVIAWYEWGKENGFYYFEKDGFIPKRGDIVIYNNIIPKKYKPENSTWCDHIGIVLLCHEDMLTVAEGNGGNQNISIIAQRKRDDTIGGYIRIPSDYEYDGWKIDYKTGVEKICEL